MRTKRLVGVLVALALAVAGGALLSAPSVTLAQQANASCTATLSPGSYTNVTVPPNQTCALETGVTVSGTVIVQSGATLYLNGATVGSLVAQQGTSINFLCGTVTGNVSDTNGAFFSQGSPCRPPLNEAMVNGNEAISGVTAQIDIGLSTIGGNLTVNNNHVAYQLSVESNQVGNNLTVDNNTASDGIYVSSNTVTNNLVCTGDAPPPTATGNTARQTVGQCANAPS